VEPLCHSPQRCWAPATGKGESWFPKSSVAEKGTEEPCWKPAAQHGAHARVPDRSQKRAKALSRRWAVPRSPAATAPAAELRPCWSAGRHGPGGQTQNSQLPRRARRSRRLSPRRSPTSVAVFFTPLKCPGCSALLGLGAGRLRFCCPAPPLSPCSRQLHLRSAARTWISCPSTCGFRLTLWSPAEPRAPLASRPAGLEMGMGTCSCYGVLLRLLLGCPSVGREMVSELTRSVVGHREVGGVCTVLGVTLQLWDPSPPAPLRRCHRIASSCRSVTECLCLAERCQGPVPVRPSLPPPEPAGEGLLRHSVCGPWQAEGESPSCPGCLLGLLAAWWYQTWTGPWGKWLQQIPV